MPYINELSRNALNQDLETLTKSLKSLNPDERAGNLNYTITYLINELYPVNKYRELNDAIGMLECCKQELYRRRVGPYEDTAIVKNGDMSNYPHIEKVQKPTLPAGRFINESSKLMGHFYSLKQKIKDFLGWG